MSTISRVTRVLSTIPGIGLPEISEVKSDWKQALLSGKDGNDLVTLFLGKSQNGDAFLASESQFSEKLGIDNVGEMIKANSLTLGYPLFYIKEALGLKEIPLNTAYPLLYRSASILLEAERLRIRNAVLILESSNLSSIALNVYQDFAKLLCEDWQLNYFHKSQLIGRANFYFGLFDANQKQIH